MMTVDMVKASGAVAQKSLAELLSALKSGDVKAQSRALKTGAIAAFVVKKGQAIAANAEKYETAAADKAECEKTVLPALAKSTDYVAIAEGITRYNAAKRKASAITKLEAQFGRLAA